MYKLILGSKGSKIWFKLFAKISIIAREKKKETNKMPIERALKFMIRRVVS